MKKMLVVFSIGIIIGSIAILFWVRQNYKFIPRKIPGQKFRKSDEQWEFPEE